MTLNIVYMIVGEKIELEQIFAGYPNWQFLSERKLKKKNNQFIWFKDCKKTVKNNKVIKVPNTDVLKYALLIKRESQLCKIN